MFDREQFCKKFNNHPKLIQVTASSFLKSWPEDFELINEAVKSGDPESIRKTAHRLKGSLAYFGSVTAFNFARELEQMGKKQEVSGAAEHTGLLKNALLELETEIQDLLKEYS